MRLSVLISVIKFGRHSNQHDNGQNMRTTNLLGALAQLATDQQLKAIEEDCGLNPTEAAALVSIGVAPGQQIDFLQQAINRSHSASVRLVDKLAAQGLVVRDQATDGRAVALHLSAKGTKKSKEVLRARNRALEVFIQFLTSQEREALDSMLAKLLAASVMSERHAYQMCRLCDGDACDVCPVEETFLTEE